MTQLFVKGLFDSETAGFVRAGSGVQGDFLQADGSWGPAGFIGHQVLTGSGTYVPTTGTCVVIVEQIGCGGGGGGAEGGPRHASGAGGNSGVYLLYKVGTPGVPLVGGPYVIPTTGGAGGTSAGGNGATGSDSTIELASVVHTAKGGTGGGGGLNDVTTLTSPGAQSVGSSSAYITVQGMGHPGVNLFNYAYSGHGGSTPMGGGGGTSIAPGVQSPTGSGGGGGGAMAEAVGVAGANGGPALCVIYEFTG